VILVTPATVPIAVNALGTFDPGPAARFSSDSTTALLLTASADECDVGQNSDWTQTNVWQTA
jgi:hypothetical protein